LLKLLPGDRPTVGPLLPIVLPFIELPVVVELALEPPEAELPPAVAPAEDPGLWAKAELHVNANRATTAGRSSFLMYELLSFRVVARQRSISRTVPKLLLKVCLSPLSHCSVFDDSWIVQRKIRKARIQITNR
jgi:hypothetical protein